MFPFAGAAKVDLVKVTYVLTTNFKLVIFKNIIGVQRLLKDKEDLPANRVKPDELLWILDKSAAAALL